MARFGKFRVQVVVGGQPCKEYSVDDNLTPSAEFDSRGQVRQYVLAEPGAHFAVRMVLEKDFIYDGHDALEFDVFIDGSRVPGRLLKEDRYQKKGRWTYDCNGRVLADGCFIQRFNFQQISTRISTSHDQIQDLKAELAELGTIEVRVRRVKCISCTFRPTKTLREAYGADLAQIPEDALKGRVVSLGTEYGEVESRKPSKRSYHVSDIDKRPCANFVFKYRTKKDLQQLGVIEREHDPRDLPIEDRPAEKLLLEEVRELQELLSSKRAELQLVKLEGPPPSGTKRGWDGSDGEDGVPKAGGIITPYEDDDVVFLESRRVKRRAIAPPGEHIVDVDN